MAQKYNISSWHAIFQFKHCIWLAVTIDNIDLFIELNPSFRSSNVHFHIFLWFSSIFWIFCFVLQPPILITSMYLICVMKAWYSFVVRYSSAPVLLLYSSTHISYIDLDWSVVKATNCVRIWIFLSALKIGLIKAAIW